MLSYSGITDIGLRREKNEDAFHIKKICDSLIFLMIADGMGGHNAGEVASSLAIKSAQKQLEARNIDDFKDE